MATVRRPFLSTSLTLPPQTAAALTPAGILTLPLNENPNGGLRSRLGLALSVRLVRCLPAGGVTGGVTGGSTGGKIGGVTVAGAIGSDLVVSPVAPLLSVTRSFTSKVAAAV